MQRNTKHLKINDECTSLATVALRREDGNRRRGMKSPAISHTDLSLWDSGPLEEDKLTTSVTITLLWKSHDSASVI